MDPVFVTANLIEAGFWCAIGLIFGAMALRRGADRRGDLAMAVVFVLFGLSDVVETRTGAWWRPWWLLAWKSGCILAFACRLRSWRRAGRDR